MQTKPNSKYEQLLEAGIEIFYLRGIEKATIDEIVNSAQCGKGTFYNYFKNKEALLDDLGARFSNEITQNLELAISGSKTTQENLHSALNGFLSVFHRNKKLGKVIHERDCRMTPEEHKKEGMKFSKNILTLKTCLGKIINNKSLRKIEPENLLSVLMGSAHFFLMREIKFGIPFTDKDIKEVVDIIHHGVEIK